MLQKFKITSCAFILCLFGVTLTTVSPVLAEDSKEFKECQQIKTKKNLVIMKQKKNCFKDLARALNPAVEELQAALDKAEADKVELQAFVDKAQASGGFQNCEAPGVDRQRCQEQNLNNSRSGVQHDQSIEYKKAKQNCEAPGVDRQKCQEQNLVVNY
jgi:hypothetical protein